MFLMMLFISVLFLCVGFVLAVFLLKKNSKDYNNEKSFLNNIINNFKEKRIKKQKQKDIREKMMYQAKLDAMKSMYPDYVKHMREQERKKMTGEYKKEKLSKFSKMFEMDNSNNKNNDFEEKIKNLLK